MKIYLKRDGKAHRWIITIAKTKVSFKTSKDAINFINEVKAVN